MDTSPGSRPEEFVGDDYSFEYSRSQDITANLKIRRLTEYIRDFGHFKLQYFDKHGEDWMQEIVVLHPRCLLNWAAHRKFLYKHG